MIRRIFDAMLFIVTLLTNFKTHPVGCGSLPRLGAKRMPRALLTLILLVLSTHQVAAQDAVDASRLGLNYDSRVVLPSVVGDAVDSTGVYTQQVPLKIPAYRGLPIDLALQYSSDRTGKGSPDSILGRGWSLRGASTIRRASAGGGAPFYSDGKDVFYLDGEPLLACNDAAATNKWTEPYPTAWKTTANSASCTSGGNFTTMNESHLKVLFSGGVWTVWRRDGVRQIYRPASHFSTANPNPGSNGDKVLRSFHWLLSEIVDTQVNPNRVAFTWGIDSNANGFAHRLTEINYASYKVRLNYDVGAIDVTYGTGTPLLGRQRARLASVEILDGADKIRAFRLNYSLSAATQQSLLSSVREYGSNYVMSGSRPNSGSTLPPYTFSYSAETMSYSDTTASGLPPNFNNYTFERLFPIITEDFNGSGRDDVLFPGYNVNGYLRCTDGCHVPSDVEGSLVPFSHAMPGALLTLDGPNGRVTSARTGNVLDSRGGARGNFVNRALMGVIPRSSDDEKALILQTEQYLDSLNPNPKINIVDPLTDGTNLNFAVLASMPTGFYDILMGRFESKAGIGVIDSTANGFRSLLINAGNIDTSNAGVSGLAAANYILWGAPEEKPFVVDIDGNGLSDVINIGYRRHFSHAPPHMLRNDRGNLGQQIAAGLPGISSYFFTYGVYGAFGDFNGDGMADFASPKLNSTNIDVYLSNGNGYGAATTWANPARFSTPSDLVPANASDPFAIGQMIKLVVRDVNGDGLDDIIQINPDSAKAFCVNDTINYGASAICTRHRLYPARVFLSTGSSFVPMKNSLGQDIIIYDYSGSGDFNGDGILDFWGRTNSSVPSNRYRIMSYGTSAIPNLLVRAESPFGGVTEISYRSIRGTSDNEFRGEKNIVGSVAIHDGRATAPAVYNYTFAGARFDEVYNRFLGFRTMTVSLPQISGESQPVNVRLTYSQTMASIGLPVLEETLQGTTVYSSKTYQYNLRQSRPFRARLTGEITANRFGGQLIRSRKDFGYNVYGLQTSVVDFGFVGAGPEYADLNSAGNLTTLTSYQPNMAAYIVDKPRSVLIQQGTSTAENRALRLYGEWFRYDGAANNTTAPTRGNLTQRNVWSGNLDNDNARRVVTFTYDAWGNVLSETDARNAVTTHSYDTAKRLFRLTTTNALSQVVTTAWHTTCQLPLTVTDANGLATTHSYDVFCRETEQLLPNGQYRRTTYNSMGNPTAQNVRVASRSGSAVAGRLQSFEWTWLDGLGRPWKQANTGTTSTQADATTVLSGYDARGNLAWKSIPLTWAAAEGVPAATQRTTFAYDPADRLLTESFADGTKRTTEYVAQSLISAGTTAVSHPGVRTQDAHCFDAASANTVCGDHRRYFDPHGNLVRDQWIDVDQTDIGGGGGRPRNTNYRYHLFDQLTEITDPSGATWSYLLDTFGNRVSVTDPGLGTWNLAYDANNNLTSQTDAKGQVITFVYDALNRMTLKRVGSGASRVETRFTYDEVRAGFHNKGHETAQEVWVPASGGTVVHRREQDWHNSGQVAVERHTIDGRTYALETSFNNAGTPSNLRLPNAPGGTGTALTGALTYDAAGRITAMAGRISSITYDLRSQPLRIDYANGAYEVISYNARRGWPTSIEGRISAGDALSFRADYTRTATGRISRYDTGTGDRAGAYAYDYDYAGRLLSATNQRNQPATNQVLSYDTAGRIRSKGQSADTATAYVYNANTPVHAPVRVTEGGVTTTFAYDANGNTTTGLGGRAMTYDGENRPLSVTVNGVRTCYVYGVNGIRLKKIEGLAAGQNCATVPASAPATVYFGPVEIRNWMISGQEVVLTYPQPNVRLRNGGNTSYLHRDHLGSVRAITGTSGAKEESAVYKPFGEANAWMAAGLAAPESKGWIGERYDSDAGLQYLNARYYDPVLGMFLQPDWLDVLEPGVGTNRYSYSFNDPVNKLDPGGNEWYNDWHDFRGLFRGRNEVRADGTRMIESAPVMRAIVPGQISWDNAVTALANDRATEAAIHATAMVAYAATAVLPAGQIGAKSGMAMPTTGQIAAEGAESVVFKNGWRTLDGKFASPLGAGRAGGSAEIGVWDAIAAKAGWNVRTGNVAVRDASGKLRYYDGIAISPRDRIIGLEVKSGDASRTAAQRLFDTKLNSSPSNVATGVGQSAGTTVQRSILIRPRQ